MTEMAIRTPRDLVDWVRSPDRREQLALALPEDVTIDRFERLTATALLQRPDLIDADRTSLWFALLDAAKRGLAPDGRQGVINVYRTKVKRNGQEETINAATFIPMISGVRDELAKYGWALRTSVIYAADTFAYDKGNDLVTHEQAPLSADRGEIVGAWAQIVRLRDGFRMNEVMPRDQIEDVRDKARAGDSPLWRDRFPQACEKTVGHRLAKKAPLDPKERERINLIIEADHNPVDELPAPSAAEQLYGPETSEATADSPASEPAAAEATPQSPSAAAPPDDEPEPGPDPEPPAPEPAADPQAAINAAAEEASRYVPPNGKYAAGGQLGPKTLQEILEQGAAGAEWLAWALGKIGAPPEYEAAVWSYARVFAPGLYQEALARKEARA